MAYILKVDVSPFAGNSTSLKLGNAFVKAFSTANPNVEVRVRDLSANPLPHLDGEAISASFVPDEGRSAGQQSKHQARLDLIKEIAEAKAVVVTVPLWNWSIPSVLKAYIDHIILMGAMDPYTARKLSGKKVTVLIGAGGGYGPGSAHPEWEFITPYLTHIFTSLGSEDVQIIRTEFTMAGVAPGMEALVPAKEKSLAESIAAAEARAASI